MLATATLHCRPVVVDYVKGILSFVLEDNVLVVFRMSVAGEITPSGTCRSSLFIFLTIVFPGRPQIKLHKIHQRKVLAVREGERIAAMRIISIAAPPPADLLPPDAPPTARKISIVVAFETNHRRAFLYRTNTAEQLWSANDIDRVWLSERTSHYAPLNDLVWMSGDRGLEVSEKAVLVRSRRAGVPVCGYACAVAAVPWSHAVACGKRLVLGQRCVHAAARQHAELRCAPHPGLLGRRCRVACRHRRGRRARAAAGAA